MSEALQTVLVTIIVLVAAAVVVRKMAREIQGFRSGRAQQSKPRSTPAPPQQLIQIQTRPPAHVRRPPTDEA